MTPFKTLVTTGASALALMLVPVAAGQVPQALPQTPSQTQPQEPTTTPSTMPEAVTPTPALPGSPQSQTTPSPNAATPSPDQSSVQPQAAQPAPAPQQTAENCVGAKTVYFGFDSANLDGEHEDLAKAASECQPKAVLITGFADRSGNEDYNMMLTEKRVEAVKAALVSQGVPATLIKVEAKGEAEATGNAKEDRRVEVEFQTAAIEDATPPV